MDKDLLQFLKVECKFKENQLQEIITKFEEGGLNQMDDLISLNQNLVENLKEFGLKLMQIKTIQNQLQKSSKMTFADGDKKVVQKEILSISEAVELKIDEKPEKIQSDSDKLDEDKKVSVKTVVKKHIDTHADKKNVYTLFQTFEDSSSEYKMKKIMLNESDFLELFARLKDPQVETAAFYGDYSQCLQLAEQFIEQRASQSLILDEGLVALTNRSRIALVYKTNHNIYDQKSEVDSNNLAVTYLRYLLDTCHYIFAVQPQSQSFYKQSQNPYKEFINPGFEMQEMIVEPDEKISVEEIKLSADKSNLLYKIQSFKGYLDFQKFIIDPKFELIYNESDIIIQFWSEKNYSYQKFSYSQAKEFIIKEWPRSNEYFNNVYNKKKLQSQLQTILTPFIQQNRQSQFCFRVEKLSEIYDTTYNEIIYKMRDVRENKKLEVSKTINEFIQECNCELFKEIIDQKPVVEVQSNGLIETYKNIKNFVQNGEFEESDKCTSNCKPLSYLRNELNLKQYTNINWDFVMKTHLNTCIHKNKISQLKKLIKKQNEKVQEYYFDQEKEVQKEIFQIRQNLLIELFDYIQEIILTKKVEVQNNFQISFSGINIIRNEKHEVTSWNLIQYPINFSGKFPKESNQSVSLMSLLFINETTGIILFRNTPLEKSSIYYFNISNKGSPILKLVQNFSSLGKQIIMEPNFKQLLMYDNTQKLAHLMKISNTGTIEGEIQVQIYNVLSDGCDGLTIGSIKSACFLPFGDKFFILSAESNLFEYRISSRKLFYITKRINKDSKIVKELIRPEKEDDVYLEIQVLADGKSIILISIYSIDIYDLNYDKMMSFPKTNDFLFLKCYNDKLNNFLIIFSKSNTKCYQIKGLSAVKHYESQITGNKSQSQLIGNPIFDYIYQSVKKFGPHSSFLGCPQDTQLSFVYHESELDKIDIKNYFRFLSLQDISMVPKHSSLKDNLFDHFEQTMATKDLKMILLGRVAIHIATIENFTLVPLRNGANISDQIAQNFVQNRDQIQNFIQRIKELIKFGIYEKVFEDHKTPLIVISIVGKQSSGKSYVMNRFFGTRFNVAATRCTDGIWMSIVRTNHNGIEKVFVVLDCEGLFSARRNETEEMKLCLALSAVSDIMILNQDLSFSRYLNILFNNFSKCIGRIKGKQLFKGCLMMLIRDVKSDEAGSAYHELQSNLLQLQQNDQDKFLSVCFQGRLLSQCLNYFSQPIFKDEIAHVREKYFFSMIASRWKNGIDFADSLKIALAQIFSDDDSDIDIYMIKIKCENALIECLDMFYQSSEHFEGEGGILKMELEIAGQQYNLVFRQEQFKLNFQEEVHRQEVSEYILQIHQEFQNQTTQLQNIYHNSYKIAFNKFFDAFLEQRMKFVLEFFNQKFQAVEEFIDTIKSFEFKLKKELEQTISKLKYCDRTCRDCKRICSKNYEHRNDCDCESGHICEEKCKISKNCEIGGYLCVEKFGHEGDHRCSIGNHKCIMKCEIESCKFICSQNLGHLDSENHNCGNKHPCSEKCVVEACGRTCHYDFINDHEKHNCGSIKCVYKCVFCGENCCSQNHLHDEAIKENQMEGMIHTHDDGQKIVMQHHLCQTTHNCQNQCTEKGICNQTFKIEEKIWKNEFGEFTYNQVIPIAETIQCKIFIDKFQIEHEGNHDCRQPHRCPEQCPECRSFCNKDIDHDGMHSSKAHRNKENCVFVSTKDSSTTKIVIEDDKKKREYKIGESCQPESCDRSCERKGRSHYHIKECKGGDACEGKLYPYVKHSAMKFEPFTDKVFDLWLCTNYWNSMNWEPPVNGGVLTLIQQCNYICGHSSHGEEQSFCTKESWHSEMHSFCCEHKFDSGVIDIVFCMDTTGSMSSYIENSKNTVTKLMNLFNIDGRSLKFGFVAYKDHPPEDLTYVTLCQDLTDQVTCQDFINRLTADGGGDGPEAVLDGLYDSTNKMTWRKDSMRFLFHIGDAPPHGKLYVASGDDGFPQGCPCNYTIQMIAQMMEEKQIRYRQLKISSYTNQMTAVFSKYIKDFEEVQIDSAQQLDIKVSEIIAREISTDEIDIIKIAGPLDCQVLEIENTSRIELTEKKSYPVVSTKTYIVPETKLVPKVFSIATKTKPLAEVTEIVPETKLVPKVSEIATKTKPDIAPETKSLGKLPVIVPKTKFITKEPEIVEEEKLVAEKSLIAPKTSLLEVSRTSLLHEEPITTRLTFPVFIIVKDKQPFLQTCQFCGHEGLNHCKKSLNYKGIITISFIIAFSLILVIPIFFIWIPYVIKSMYECTFSCKYCQNVIATTSEKIKLNKVNVYH